MHLQGGRNESSLEAGSEKSKTKVGFKGAKKLCRVCEKTQSQKVAQLGSPISLTEPQSAYRGCFRYEHSAEQDLGPGTVAGRQDAGEEHET